MLDASVQELATRATSRAVAEAAKNITPPKSAYEFEVSWRGFAGDHALQARLLKVCQNQQCCTAIAVCVGGKLVAMWFSISSIVLFT